MNSQPTENGATVGKTWNGTLTPAQARVLLLVSLEDQAASEITDRLAERGHIWRPETVKKTLADLATLGLIECHRSKGRSGWRYRLGTGAQVETALDQAHEMTRAT